jgi:hypothetical protein
LIWSQLEKRRVLQRQIVRLRNFAKQHSQRLKEDIHQYDEIRTGERERFEWRKGLNREPER